MDPVTAIVFASILTVAPVSSRQRMERNSDDISNTVYVIDRRATTRSEIIVLPAQNLTNLIVEQIPNTVSINDPVFAELISYRDFQDGWDGDGSVAPSAGRIDAAIAFAEMARPYFPAPTAMLSYDGEIGLYWSTPEIYIDIAFEADDTISIYSRDRTHQPNTEEFLSGLSSTSLESLFPLMEKLSPIALAA